MLLKSQSLESIIIFNILLIAIWHIICFLVCINFNSKNFSKNKKYFEPKSWERNGQWYQKYLKIKKWKDKLPQQIGKNRFSKKHIQIETLSIEYIDDFIFETCRAEWDHRANCLYSLIILVVSPLSIGMFFSILNLILNLPFIFIQRYNRFRLLKLQKKMIFGN